MALVRTRAQKVQDVWNSNYLELGPPLVESGHLNEFLASGRTTQFTLSPRANAMAVYPAPLVPQVSLACIEGSKI